MLKWLVITLIVLSGFMVVLLGLGYLLSENEKATTALKNQLEQEALAQQQKSQQRDKRHQYSEIITSIDDETLLPTSARKPSPELLLKPSSKAVNAEILKKFQSTLRNNLTCVTVAQCQKITVRFKNIDCQLASNLIGASELKKIATDTVVMANCPLASEHSEVACQQNICTLISSP